MSGLASLLLSPLDMCALCMLQVLLIEFLALNVEKTKVFINFTTQSLINLLMATHVKSEVARSLVLMMPDQTGFSRQSGEQEKPLFHAKTLILFIKQSPRGHMCGGWWSDSMMDALYNGVLKSSTVIVFCATGNAREAA